MSKFCRDCKYFKDSPMSWNPECVHPTAGHDDLVTGRRVENNCYVMRRLGCGYDGNWFEPKDANTPPIAN